ncbi:regulator of G-protein signaling 16-like [Spea bombifrons]|uniref:regulator of G-protein signaling 16-like n=1 Tax=Spea bombifrons TaxID=233779 RepID=UPI002349823F|nr:regulator of G-protein signaling 16-like [Spea bombifrons]
MCRGHADTHCTCPEWAKELRLSIGNLIHKLEIGHHLLASTVCKKRAKNRTLNNNSKKEAMKLKESFGQLLSSKDGLLAFQTFLKTEFSEENLEFWMACEEYRMIESDSKLRAKAQIIYQEFLQSGAPQEVNIDHQTRELTRQQMKIASRTCFDAAQEQARILMEKDSYPRFIKSPLYKDLSHHSSLSKFKLSFT